MEWDLHICQTLLCMSVCSFLFFLFFCQPPQGKRIKRILLTLVCSEALHHFISMAHWRVSLYVPDPQCSQSFRSWFSEKINSNRIYWLYATHPSYSTPPAPTQERTSVSPKQLSKCASIYPQWNATPPVPTHTHSSHTHTHTHKQIYLSHSKNKECNVPSQAWRAWQVIFRGQREREWVGVLHASLCLLGYSRPMLYVVIISIKMRYGMCLVWHPRAPGLEFSRFFFLRFVFAPIHSITPGSTGATW